jgi:hypothetical protein
VGIDFERGAFENPDTPWYDDDVDSAIVVVPERKDRGAALRAAERCIDRWWGIDGAGRHHGSDDETFWDAQFDHDGAEWHTAKYFSEPQVTEVGIEVDVDAQSFMPAPMRDAYRRVLVEELAAAGVGDAIVRSQNAEDYETIEQPTGSWPPYADGPVPGLPPGVPPGRLLRHDLRRDGDFRVEYPLNRDFEDAWVAEAAAASDQGEDLVVPEVYRLFTEAGWRVREVEGPKPDGKLVAAAVAEMDHAVAVVVCAFAPLSKEPRGSVCPQTPEALPGSPPTTRTNWERDDPGNGMTQGPSRRSGVLRPPQRHAHCFRMPDPACRVVAQSEWRAVLSSALYRRWPYGNTHRNVLRIGLLHQQSGRQPHEIAPNSSTNRPMIANSRYSESARTTMRLTMRG